MEFEISDYENGKVLFKSTGVYKTDIDNLMSLPEDYFVLSVFYSNNTDQISIAVFLKSDNKKAAKLIIIANDMLIDFNIHKENVVVDMEYFNDQAVIDGCINLGVL